MLVESRIRGWRGRWMSIREKEQGLLCSEAFAKALLQHGGMRWNMEFVWSADAGDGCRRSGVCRMLQMTFVR